MEKSNCSGRALVRLVEIDKKKGKIINKKGQKKITQIKKYTFLFCYDGLFNLF